MASNTLSPMDKGVLWSPLPTLLVHDTYRTTGLSRNGNKLTPDQVLPWTEFEYAVKSLTRNVAGHPDPHCYEMQEDERYWAGNELGVQSRFVEHIGQKMGKIYETSGYQVRFGDFQAGVPMKTRKTTKKSTANYPDIAIITIGSHLLSITGEFKTEWTFFPKQGQTEEEFLAKRLGTYYFIL